MIKDKQEGIAITRGSAGSIHHNKVIDPYPNYDTINSQRVWSDTLNIRIGIYVATCDSLFGTRNIDIYNNNVTGATSGISINTEDNASIDSIRVYNNVISGTNSGINTSHCYSSRGQKRHITIAHNTIRSKYSDLRIADTIQLVNDWKIYNNLLAGFNSYGINIKRVAKGVFHNAYDSSGIVIRNNAYANIIPNGVPPVQNGTDSVLVGQSFVTGGLGLVDTTTGDTVDFHITSSSAARDAGTSAITWPFDYDSLSRPVNDSVDIGAYEFRSWK
jgi:hypothetical protein